MMLGRLTTLTRSGKKYHVRILMGYEVGYASDKQKFPPHKPGKLLL
jgi:hypothetical protein